MHVNLSHSKPSVKRKLPQTCDDYISQQPTLIQELTQHYKQSLTAEPLFTYIIQQTTLIISTNGAKGERLSGDSWIIALEDDAIFIQGYAPNFGQIRDINSYRAEIYASLSTTLFIRVYSTLYMVTLTNKYIAIYDNQDNVNKLF